jgi:hypothetical protein
VILFFALTGVILPLLMIVIVGERLGSAARLRGGSEVPGETGLSATARSPDRLRAGEVGAPSGATPRSGLGPLPAH